VNGPTRWMRVLRGTLAASFATFVAAFSHVLVGGAAPSAAGVAVTLALSSLLCIALSGRALSLWRTAVAVGASQMLFHALFSTMRVAGPMTDVSPAVSGHAGHAGVAVDVLAAPMAVSTGHSPSMWVAHAVAAVITVAAIRYAEKAFTAARDAASLFLAVLVAAVLVVPLGASTAPARIGCTQTMRPRDVRLLLSALRHRGPPVLSAA
jgi:hypothetical protein